MIIIVIMSGMMLITGKTYDRVRKKSFGGTFSFSNCHIIGLDNGSLIVFGQEFIRIGKLIKELTNN
jgi:hypothetical protein